MTVVIRITYALVRLQRRLRPVLHVMDQMCSPYVTMLLNTRTWQRGEAQGVTQLKAQHVPTLFKEAN